MYIWVRERDNPAGVPAGCSVSLAVKSDSDSDGGCARVRHLQSNRSNKREQRRHPKTHGQATEGEGVVVAAVVVGPPMPPCAG